MNMFVCKYFFVQNVFIRRRKKSYLESAPVNEGAGTLSAG